MSYKIIYDRENCIGANACVGVLPEYWRLDETKKAVLKGSILNKRTGKYELVIDERDLNAVLERFKESAVVCPVYVIDIIDTVTQKSILNIDPATNEVAKESAPVIKALAGQKDEKKSDPKGFFTIKIYPETGLIKVWYYSPKHQLLFIIEGKNAEELYSTIVREGFVTLLSCAAHLGSELQKAEIALKKNLPYTQDQPLG